MNGTGTAKCHATAIFRSCQSNRLSENPEKGCLWTNIDFILFPVYIKRDHELPPFIRIRVPIKTPFGSVLLKEFKIFYERTTDRVNGVNSVFGTILHCIFSVSYPLVFQLAALKNPACRGRGDIHVPPSSDFIRRAWE
jgi:hypothetical protein